MFRNCLPLRRVLPATQIIDKNKHHQCHCEQVAPQRGAFLERNRALRKGNMPAPPSVISQFTYNHNFMTFDTNMIQRCFFGRTQQSH